MESVKIISSVELHVRQKLITLVETELFIHACMCTYIYVMY